MSVEAALSAGKGRPRVMRAAAGDVCRIFAGEVCAALFARQHKTGGQEARHRRSGVSRISKLSYAQQVCVKAAGKAMQSTGMLHPGARVGVAVSGGVDSFVLLKVLQIRQRIVPFPFEIMALHLNPGFDPTNHARLPNGWPGRALPGISKSRITAPAATPTRICAIPHASTAQGCAESASSPCAASITSLIWPSGTTTTIW